MQPFADRVTSYLWCDDFLVIYLRVIQYLSSRPVLRLSSLSSLTIVSFGSRTDCFCLLLVSRGITVVFLQRNLSLILVLILHLLSGQILEPGFFRLGPCATFHQHRSFHQPSSAVQHRAISAFLRRSTHKRTVDLKWKKMIVWNIKP